ncbi:MULTISPECIES: peptidoglycan-binding domain-containing protein [unclassified Streptomyces]|uniref:peptidoglycan-binding domain-containing protein n=1 Tax=unclassified Streptomyces TaxID=2593676 RepID=UPI00214B7FB4|nr:MULTISPECIES: peptidoglycan-binding domain-containing protein [unclassified Streptomyces]
MTGDARGERGTPCPECGGPRSAAGVPSCDCAERAAEALRETREAEAAAAEDFDLLRIRPYVEVGPDAPDAARPVPPVEAALPPRPAAGPAGPEVRLFASPAAPDGAEPPAPERPGPPGPAGGRHRLRRTALVAAAGAGAVAVAAVGLALFSYHSPSRDDAAPDIRESVPGLPPPDPSGAPVHGAPAPSRSAARSPLPPAPPSTTSSPTSPSAPSPTPTARRTPSGAASPTPSAPTAPPTTPAGAPALRRGDVGPQVADLQFRLWQLNLYEGAFDGVFTRSVENGVRTYQLARGVQGDPAGVYGPATRAALEGETSGR